MHSAREEASIHVSVDHALEICAADMNPLVRVWGNLSTTGTLTLLGNRALQTAEFKVDQDGTLVIRSPQGVQRVRIEGDLDATINGVDVKDLQADLYASKARLDAAEAAVKNLTDIMTQLLSSGSGSSSLSPKKIVLRIESASSDAVNGLYTWDGMSEGRPTYVKMNEDGSHFTSQNNAYVWVSYHTSVKLTKTTGNNAISGSCKWSLSFL